MELVDGMVQQVRDLDLEDQPDEGQDHRDDEDDLVGAHDREGAAQPGLGPVGIDGRPGRLVARLLGHRDELRSLLVGGRPLASGQFHLVALRASR